MALSQAARLRLAEALRESFQIASGLSVFKHGYAAIGSAAHATAAKRGRLFAWNDEAGAIPAGLIVDLVASGLGGQDTATGTATDANQASVAIEDFVIESINVTGASAVTDAFKDIYWTDDATLSLTPGTLGVPMGRVLRWRGSGTDCRVLVYGVSTMAALVAAGVGVTQEMFLGSWPAAAMANGNILTGRVLQDSGSITGFYAQITQAPAGTGGTATINLEVDTVNVGPTTPTSIVVATGNALGLRTASAAISVNNTFSRGSVLDVEASGVTAMTAGHFNLFMLYTRRTGL